MKRLLITASLAASMASPAFAQKADIIIVDSDRILSECTACKAANTQLQQRQTTLRTRAQTLQTQITTEGKTLQTAITALGGKDPDAALQQKITAFEAKQRNAQQELSNSEQTLQSTLANVQRQIGTKLVAVVEQVRARRGAAIALSKSSTLANDTAADVTAEVLAALNQQLPSVSVTPLPQQQQQTQTQGR